MLGLVAKAASKVPRFPHWNPGEAMNGAIERYGGVAKAPVRDDRITCQGKESSIILLFIFGALQHEPETCQDCKKIW